jgi:hypothetical protein
VGGQQTVDDRAGDELRALVQEYQAALREGDGPTLLRLFHPSAEIIYPEGPELVRTPAEDFVAEVVGMVAAGEVVDETPRAVDVDIAGPVAVVRVDFHLQLGDEHFEGTDLYTVAALDGKWRITQKLYAMAPASP